MAFLPFNDLRILIQIETFLKDRVNKVFFALAGGGEPGIFWFFVYFLFLAVP